MCIAASPSRLALDHGLEERDVEVLAGTQDALRQIRTADFWRGLPMDRRMVCAGFLADTRPLVHVVPLLLQARNSL